MADKSDKGGGGPPQETASGSRRAAAFLLGLGPELAKSIFSQLSESELRRIAQGAKSLRRESGGAVPDALNHFVDSMVKVGGDAAASDELLKEMAAQALGPEVARRAFDSNLAPPADEVLGPLADADAESLAMILAREQAQTVALVLSSLPPIKAAAVMDFIPDTQRPAIVRRMAVIEGVAPEVLREVRQALTHELQAAMSEGVRKVDGRNVALEILRRCPAAEQADVLKAIEGDDPALASDLRTKLFTFEDLRLLGDRDMQTLIKDVDTNRLMLALKGSSAEVKDKFLKNMSSRAAQMFADDLAAMGPVRIAVVEEAQAEITKLAVGLADAGRITIIRPTDKML